ncbi:hypothetical protein Cgig2_019266 [Carnegiea gigantea]|uniref:Transferrin receptor-like dimerisation domain-containing protein n=1 Tax=Carnegiea gigantea TaxID=171969 RepID=A0A9Q1KP67_9CARY|nr:hypothetical protein Cgig2_019266 [Carnegiea gigantea]
METQRKALLEQQLEAQNQKIAEMSNVQQELLEKIMDLMKDKNVEVVEDFRKLHQWGSMDEYLEKFEGLKSLMLQKTPVLPDDYFIASFVAGLKPHLKPFVKALNPLSLDDAVQFARLQEEATEALKVNKNLVGAKSPLLPTPQSVTSGSNPNSRSFGAWSGQGITYSGSSASSVAKPASQSFRPTRVVTAAERADKIAKGLLFSIMCRAYASVITNSSGQLELEGKLVTVEYTSYSNDFTIVIEVTKNRIGSTEWVEQNIMNLGSRAVSYLNVDCAVQGPGLFASMTPQLDDIFVDITKKVKDPDAEGTTIYGQWTARNKGVFIQRLSGVDSDFAPFLQHAGVSSLDIYYGKDFPVYHTAFDSYDWMINYGDPSFQRHAAGLWGLIALRLADDPILPFNYVTYAEQLQEYAVILSSVLEGRASVLPINTSVRHLLAAAKEIQREVKKLRADGSLGEVEVMKERVLSDRLMLAERGLLDAEGLLGSRWFKHLVYGPSVDSESKLSFFPSVANAIYQSTQVDGGNNATIQHEIWRAARAIQRAADALKGDLIS